MRDIEELLREADPLRHEPALSEEQRSFRRQAVLSAASRAHVGARARPQFALLALAALAAIVVSSLGGGLRSFFVGEVQAAVRFEARLAEGSPDPELREAKVAGSTRSVYLHREVIVSNSDVTRARVIPGTDASHYGVAVEFNASGAKTMRAATEDHIGSLLAILLDGEVVEALVIRSPVGASGVISGNFTKGQAERIADGIISR